MQERRRSISAKIDCNEQTRGTGYSRIPLPRHLEQPRALVEADSCFPLLCELTFERRVGLALAFQFRRIHVLRLWLWLGLRRQLRFVAAMFESWGSRIMRSIKSVLPRARPGPAPAGLPHWPGCHRF